MRDYTIVFCETGRQYKVADLPLPLLRECLAEPGELAIDPAIDHPGDTPEKIVERLRLELLIRGLGL